MEKYFKMSDYLKSQEKIGVGFSGGVDSALLAYAAANAVGRSNVILYTVHGVQTSYEDKEASISVARELGIVQHIMDFSITKEENAILNDSLRCYYCKKKMFEMIAEKGKSHGLEFIIEGSNFSDRADYRPGIRAVKELGIISPLDLFEITKGEVRELARTLGISVWNRPSSPCLATRIPMGTKIDEKSLKRVEEAETFVRNLGFENIRVRVDKNRAKIEFIEEDLLDFQSFGVRNNIEKHFKELEFDVIEYEKRFRKE